MRKFDLTVVAIGAALLLSVVPALTAPAASGSAAPPTAPATTATPATASTPAPAAAPAKTASSIDTNTALNQIVCKSFPAPTGTRIGGGRECQTVRQWNEEQRENQQDVQHEQNRSQLFSTPSN
jgi:hypothetical protein